MNENALKRICSIELINNQWELYDCYGENLRSPSEKCIFSPKMKKSYLKARNNENSDTNTSVVWVLIGYNEDKAVWEQVGRTIDIINALNEVRENVKNFYRDDDNKYNKLKKKYKKVTFYEVNIDEYLSNDTLFYSVYGNKIPEEDYFEQFRLAYDYVKAAYVEGKLGFENDANMYHPSSLYGYFYSHFIKQRHLH